MKNKKAIKIIFSLVFFVLFGFLMTKVSQAGCPNDADYACSSDGITDCRQFESKYTVWEIYSPDNDKCVTHRNGQASVCCHMTSKRNDCEDKAGGECKDWIGNTPPSEVCQNGYLGEYDKWCSTGEYCCKKTGNSPVSQNECKDKKDGDSCTTQENEKGTCIDGQCEKAMVVFGKNYCDQEKGMVCAASPCEKPYSKTVGDSKAQKECQDLYNGEDGIAEYACCMEEEEPENSNGNECKVAGEGVQGGFLFFKGSIVPCGRSCDVGGTDIDETKNCTLCHFIIMFFNIFELLISLLVVVALLFITISGVVFLISAGNPNLRTTAKGILVKTLTGFAIALLSWLIIFTLLKFISAKDGSEGMLGSGGKWNEFTCETKSIFDE